MEPHNLSHIGPVISSYSPTYVWALPQSNSGAYTTSHTRPYWRTDRIAKSISNWCSHVVTYSDTQCCPDLSTINYTNGHPDILADWHTF
jgi:hypothetical protein